MMKCISSLAYLLALAWARPDDADHPSLLAVAGRAGETSGSHPFARYKVLARDIDAASTTTSTTPSAETTPLECFQVAEPVPSPPGSAFTENGSASRALIRNGAAITASEPACETVLMEHTFANSYGAPFVGNYTPPECDFDHVVINFTVLVKGRQYDRTGAMYLGDTEVWRTSTAEPNPTGIRWVYQKDMTPFLSLWKQPQTLIFDLENNVDDTYTGLLNTTLTATFFKLPSQQQAGQPPADRIIPISQRLGSTGKPSQFTVPEQDATNTVSFPQNVNRAVFTVDVKGQGDEEFWWSNVPQSAIHTFEDGYGTYPGYSPWREVQILIDDQLAGVSWPYPVIYTGGVLPHLHRPIVGIQAFDISEQEIDITPWLPLLCDGKDHTFTIKIVGLEDDGDASAALSTTTGSSWYVTGKVFLWLDDEDSVTTGTLGDVSANDLPKITLSQHVTQNATGGNETVEYDIAVSRDFSIRSVVQTQHSQGTASWAQSLRYSNTGGVYAYGDDNVNTFAITGSAEAVGPPGSDPSSSAYYYSTNYSYPLFCNSTATSAPEGNLTLWAVLDQGLDIEVRGDGAVFPTGLAAFPAAAGVSGDGFQGSSLSTWRNGTADYYRPADNSYTTGVGKTHQVFSFGGLSGDEGAPPTELYFRDVSAYNDTITDDHVEVAGKTI